jgi:hypothetical protein
MEWAHLRAGADKFMLLLLFAKYSAALALFVVLAGALVTLVKI